ncbi:DUF1496 domain-containing protein [Serratia ficaria]|uniref:Protein of uncharacterized function (DUF1496) n=1 Tax=Serratia ficaria TaxID=61651 RepID=A0A240C524_SERFI|nr:MULTISPECIES: DUF1496 domain-containing protein [Serratia]MEE4481966.1 DUF1496 domain-containing protein [Serratia ficaria]REF44470.1 uncharacterized protein DUF1496 [Serratia ficaria]CAI0728700.1 Protein of uncharacterised function (DUF1496) [Serratia ficaria]CAI0773073.1 Protein of uncharacterised function (DUF1496) [Serratia ficaria]CAI0778162.1 Protein of uncharacterised function (DUF1496) [Serratia ficaria]
MKHGLLMLTAGVWLVSGAAGAHRGDVDVVLPVSPEIWGAAKNAETQACNRCCVYRNQNYSEGAVLKIDDEVLQCVRDHNVVGTNPLIWVRLKK